MKNAGEVAVRITPAALIEEGKRKKQSKKRELWRDVSSSDRFAGMASDQIVQYEQLNYMFNEATALLITEDEIQFIQDDSVGIS